MPCKYSGRTAVAGCWGGHPPEGRLARWYFCSVRNAETRNNKIICMLGMLLILHRRVAETYCRQTLIEIVNCGTRHSKLYYINGMVTSTISNHTNHSGLLYSVYVCVLCELVDVCASILYSFLMFLTNIVTKRKDMTYFTLFHLEHTMCLLYLASYSIYTGVAQSTEIIGLLLGASFLWLGHCRYPPVLS